MDVTKDLPLGFGMALAQNQQAMQHFAAMSPAQQQQAMNQTKQIESKAEMQAFVSAMAQTIG